MSTTRHRHKKVLVHFQPNTAKFCSPRKNNKPSTESLESIVCLSFTFTAVLPIGIALSPHANPVRRDPVPAVLPWMWSPLPQYSRRPHYRADLYCPVTKWCSFTASKGVTKWMWCVCNKSLTHWLKLKITASNPFRQHITIGLFVQILLISN